MMETKITAMGALIAGVLAALGAAVCCTVPLLLAKLGLSGAWTARLTALAPMRPFWLAATAVFFGIAFLRLYWRQELREPGQVGSDPVVKRQQRAVFWALGTIVLLLVAFPWYAPLLF
jgi:mercuric ion transport protein